MALHDDIVKLAYDNPGPVRDALLPILSGMSSSGPDRQKRALVELPGIDRKKIAELRRIVDAGTYKLLREVYSTLVGRFSKDDEAAMNRIIGSINAGSSWDQALHQNNIFKAANLLKIKLPHMMF